MPVRANIKMFPVDEVRTHGRSDRFESEMKVSNSLEEARMAIAAHQRKMELDRQARAWRKQMEG